MTIHFGTSGWRAVIADDFTFAAVGRVTEAICSQFAGEAGRPVIVAHDTRFLGEEFAAECAEIIVEQGFEALVCDGPTPTPTVSHAIRSRRAVCGINFTASHNPPEYSGMKLSTADGAPALPAVTNSIEELLGETSEHRPKTTARKVSKSFDPRDAYLADLDRKSTRLNSSHLVISYAVFCLKK